MALTSGLGPEKRSKCYARVVQAAKLGLAKREEVHYTQGPRRWDGISNRRVSTLGEFPRYADCSSFVTWCLWNGLFLRYSIHDLVNGQDWKAGYTGTMLDHGRRLSMDEPLLPGDCVFYEPPHVTIVVSRLNGVPMVISNGSEGGPYYVKHNYRQPTQIRRYI